MKAFLAALAFALAAGPLGCGGARRPLSTSDGPEAGARAEPDAGGPALDEPGAAAVSEPETTEEVIETSSPL